MQWSKNYCFYIGDVRSFDSLKDVMHGVDYVFHAVYPINAMGLSKALMEKMNGK
jgi:FlaA1/EpsC-like NDP-sugar epimerase